MAIGCDGIEGEQPGRHASRQSWTPITTSGECMEVLIVVGLFGYCPLLCQLPNQTFRERAMCVIKIKLSCSGMSDHYVMQVCAACLYQLPSVQHQI